MECACQVSCSSIFVHVMSSWKRIFHLHIKSLTLTQGNTKVIRMYSIIVIALIFGYVQCDLFTATVTTSASNFMVGQDVICEVTITNQDSQDHFLYTRGTPLEGFKSNMFLVTLNGKPVRFNGLHFKRGPITKYSNGINIPSKKSVMVKIDLSSAYSFKYSAKYAVSLNTAIYFLDDKGKIDVYHLYSLPVTFKVFSGTGNNPKLTIAEHYRSNQAKANVQPEVGVKLGAPKKLSFEGKYNSSDQFDAINAWQKAYKSVVASPSDMDSNLAHYILWFGSTTYNNTAKGNMQDIQRSMEIFNYTLYFRGQECTPGDDYAYTFFGSTTIFLCDLYLAAKKSGFNSKFGILVNQLSQAVDDVAYDTYEIEKCKHLAKYNPSNAVRNAFNYEYFVETLNF